MNLMLSMLVNFALYAGGFVLIIGAILWMDAWLDRRLSKTVRGPQGSKGTPPPTLTQDVQGDVGSPVFKRRQWRDHPDRTDTADQT